MSITSLRLVEEIEFLAAEQRQIRAVGPHFAVFYKFGKRDSLRGPSREVRSVVLVCRAKEYVLRVSPSDLLLFAHLACHRLPESATQIAAGTSEETLYVTRGTGGRLGSQRVSSLRAPSVKVHAQRLRRAMKVTFGEAGLSVDHSRVLISEATDGRRCLYRLKATVQWVCL